MNKNKSFRESVQNDKKKKANGKKTINDNEK